MQMSLKIEGAAELSAALKALGPEATKAGRAALRQSAQDLRDRVRAAAPVGHGSTRKYRRLKNGSSQSYDYGRLRDNIRAREVKARTDNTIVFIVTTGNAFWSRFLEYGTRKMRARPFFAPVFQAERPAQVEAIRQRLIRQIELAARRLARKSKP